MNDKALKTRHRRIREQMSRLGVDCLIVTKPANVTYITGFMGDDSWAVVLPKNVILITDSRYSEQARAECSNCRIIERKEGMIKATADLLNKRQMRKIGVEKSTSIADFEGLKKELEHRIKPVANVVETVRRTKDKGEISAIRAAAKIAARALKSTIRRMRAGITENELAGLLDFEIRKLGGQNSFETIVAFGANASRPHHRPTGRKLRRNDTVLIDFGVRRNRYSCDITRCFAVGKEGRLYKKAYAAVEEAQAAALKMVRAGIEIKKVDAAARAVISKYGLPVYGHGTGHGLGLEVHEMPAVTAKSQGTLQQGDVITIEPAVYMPGRLGIRLEDDILVTQKGYVVLSNITR
jgi:Xaa-Pro aminopeptidase